VVVSPREAAFQPLPQALLPLAVVSAPTVGRRCPKARNSVPGAVRPRKLLDAPAAASRFPMAPSSVLTAVPNRRADLRHNHEDTKALRNSQRGFLRDHLCVFESLWLRRIGSL